MGTKRKYQIPPCSDTSSFSQAEKRAGKSQGQKQGDKNSLYLGGGHEKSRGHGGVPRMGQCHKGCPRDRRVGSRQQLHSLDQGQQPWSPIPVAVLIRRICAAEEDIPSGERGCNCSPGKWVLGPKDGRRALHFLPGSTSAFKSTF